MRLAHLKIALFALFLSAPLLVLGVFGVVEEYGRDHPDFPSFWQVLRARKNGPDRLGEAVLERSAASKLAVKLKSWATYRIVGFVDGPLVFSGKDGWLFYFEDFNGGHCLDETKATRTLRRVAAMIDMGAAGGIDVFMTISPNKSTIYPEMLNDRWRAYWACLPQNIASLRRLMAAEAPMIIDEAESLLAEKARNPSIPLYYRTDTHWTAYGSAIALRNLLSAVFGESTLPDAHIVVDPAKPRRTDLSALLGLQIEEPRLIRDIGDDAALRSLDRGSPPVRTTLIHDSFYAGMVRWLKLAMPDSQMAHIIHDRDHFPERIRGADRLIITMVERILLRQGEARALAPDAEIATALMDRNVARAAECRDFAVLPGIVLAIPAAAGDSLPCLRVVTQAQQPAVLEITLPGPGGGDPVPDRSVVRSVPVGRSEMSFVLPRYAAGGSVAIGLRAPGEGAGIESAAVGSLPSAGAH